MASNYDSLEAPGGGSVSGGFFRLYDPGTTLEDLGTIDEDFTAAFYWELAHPWGNIEPCVVATRDDGAPLVVGPEYSYNLVRVTFVVATAGHMTLFDPDPATLTEDVAFYGTGSVLPTPYPGSGQAVIRRGQQAVVSR